VRSPIIVLTMSFKLKLTSLFNIYNNNNAPLSSQTTAEKDTTFLFQRLSVALPRGMRSHS